MASTRGCCDLPTHSPFPCHTHTHTSHISLSQSCLWYPLRLIPCAATTGTGFSLGSTYPPSRLGSTKRIAQPIPPAMASGGFAYLLGGTSSAGGIPVDLAPVVAQRGVTVNSVVEVTGGGKEGKKSKQEPLLQTVTTFQLDKCVPYVCFTSIFVVPPLVPSCVDPLSRH